ncbi:MAG: hypothetical protein OXC70_04425 [Gammaproteobacteria bacterium]|nr:hypothetical protein [Gammaproteobacteria bacterium]
MANSAFDTLQAAESFQQAGMPADQAKAVARAIRQRGEDQVTNSGLAAALAQFETRLTNHLYISLGVLFAALVAVGFFT